MWLLAGLALAQTEVTGFSAQNYRPPVDSRTSLWTERTATFSELTFTGQLLGIYTGNPLTLPDGRGDEVQLADVIQTDLVAGIHYGRFRAGLLMPLILAAEGPAVERAAGFGDLAFDVKAALLRGEEAPLGLAVAGRLIAPSATVGGALANRNTGWELTALADKQVEHLVVAANLGLRGAPNVPLTDITLDDQLFYRASASYLVDLEAQAGVGLDVAGHFNTRGLAGGGAPIEALLGGWGHLADNVVLRGGLGTGLGGGIGDPDLRVVLGLAIDRATMDAEPRLRPARAGDAERDRDSDGVVDADDRCPSEPEVADGYLDADGCPDSGTRVNLRVTTPTGKPLHSAQLTLQAGDWTQTGTGELLTSVEPGKYQFTAVAPGYQPLQSVLDISEGGERAIVQVLQPGKAQVSVRLTDYGGRPLDGEWSADGGAWTAVTGGTFDTELAVGPHVLAGRAPGRLPTEIPFDVSGEYDNTARLELGAGVVLSGTRLELKETLTFASSSSQLGAAHYALLDEVAAVLVRHREITRIRVAGYADSQGAEALNLELSNRRAAAVAAYLKSKGVAGSRIEAIGRGEADPIAPNDTAQGRAKNRRVELTVLDPASPAS
jgi:outer membrane protein OmpA-like peptidoglycan-associated protein